MHFPSLLALGLVSLVLAPLPVTAAPPARRPALSPSYALPHDTKPPAELQPWFDTLRSELQRTWAFLEKQDKPKAYFLSYQLSQGKNAQIIARDGAIEKTASKVKDPLWLLKIDLRLGSHQLDNSGEDGHDWQVYRHLLPTITQFPGEISKEILQKRLWQMTDRAFKEATAQYHRKRYVRSLKVEIKDKSGDFSKEKPFRFFQTPKPFSFDMKRWKAIAREVSSIFLSDRSVIQTRVTLNATQTNILYVAKDGTESLRSKTIYMHMIHLTYLSSKKEFLENTRLAYVDEEGKLPSKEQLAAVARETLKEITDQSEAPEGEPTEAPAILLNDVAGVLFHEALGHRLEGQRLLNESDGRTFRHKIGHKVIPTFLSVSDNPLLTHWQGTPLNGFYLLDDQSVPSQPVSLIKDGVLKGFLLSRKPLDSFRRSNGHGRGYFTAAPFSRQGNLFIQSKKSHSFAELKAMLLEEARKQGKPHGFIIGRSSGGYTHTGTYGIQSFKNRPNLVLQVDAKTGKETLVKGLEIIGTPLTVVNHILATGSDYGVFNGFCGAESGYVPVSAIAPHVLLKTIELQRVKINQKKDFLLPPPASSTKTAKR